MTTNIDPIARIVEVRAVGATLPEAERAAIKLARREFGPCVMKPWIRSIRPSLMSTGYRVTLAYAVAL